MDKAKVFIFGIDGASPKLVLGWLDDLPNFKKLAENGLRAKTETVKPPTSIAAWTSFFSGRDPGQTGIYNYTARYREDKLGAELINSNNIKGEMLWDILGRNDKKSIVIGAISSYPAQKLKGIMLGSLLTPELNQDALYPSNLKEELLSVCGGKYMFDVSDSFTYRKFSLDELIEKAYEMTEMQVNLVKHFLKTKEWDLFSYIAMASDRLHHRLWSYLDKEHIKYKFEKKYSTAIKDYYKYLDEKFGEIIALCPSETNFIIASDHGMNRLDGRINLNDWLIEKGYLIFGDGYLKKAKTEGPVKFNPKEIDWSKTKVFATSAYEALIFINKNLLGGDYDGFCDKLANEIIEIPGTNGKKLNTEVFKAKDIYPSGFDENAPDMIVYFDNLFWGTNCDIGNRGLYSLSNLVGADDALHGREGIFMMAGREIKIHKDLGKVDILNIAPTILNLFGIEKPDAMRGAAIEYK